MGLVDPLQQLRVRVAIDGYECKDDEERSDEEFKEEDCKKIAK